MLSSMPRYAPWYKARPVNWLQSDPVVKSRPLTLSANFAYVGSSWLGMHMNKARYDVVLPDNFQAVKTALFSATSITFNHSLPVNYRAPAMPLQNAQTAQTTMTLPANYLETA